MKDRELCHLAFCLYEGFVDYCCYILVSLKAQNKEQ